MKRIVLVLATVVLSLGTAFGHSGVIRGAASDLKVAAKVAVYPVRHPKKSAKGTAKAAKATFHATRATVKAASQI